MLLLVFYYCIEDFPCRCCRFNLSLCRLLPFPLSYILFQGHVCCGLKNVKRMQYSLNYSGTRFLSTES